MDINAMNSVSKVAMPAQKTELNKPENNTVEPQKDGNKKLALALTALAATAAAGVGIAVAAKKGKIHLPTFKKSAQNIANDTIKALPNGADDAIKALPGAADDAAKAVKEGVEKKVLKQPGPFDESHAVVKRIQADKKNPYYSHHKKNLDTFILREQSRRWSEMESIKGDTLSPKGKEFCRARASALKEQANQIERDLEHYNAMSILKPKKDGLYNQIKKIDISECRDANGNVTGKMKGLMKELTKYTGETFDTPEQAKEFVCRDISDIFNTLGEYIEFERDTLYTKVLEMKNSQFRDTNGKVTQKMKWLMEELGRYDCMKFATPEQMINYVEDLLEL